MNALLAELIMYL
jgi:hypothetical protein